MLTMPVLIGNSAATRAVEQEIDCAARSDAKVLITGESGVGKEVVAQLIHSRSRRAQSPLVTVNCAGIPETLLASELFGHVRGGFTDAYRDRKGWIEQAHRGTIFLDEIGEMALSMQALLLRFLENGEIQPVGSHRGAVAVDVRVITATNRDLAKSVASQGFRADLFYRLNVIHIAIPPLRERREDIMVLLEHFLRQDSARQGAAAPVISDEAVESLVAYDWPGNVRELRNVTERLVARAPVGPVTVADLPREVLSMNRNVASRTGRPAERSRAEPMWQRMVQHGESFWAVVYEPFMARDLPRDDVRELVRRGLELTRGNYKALAQLFNVGGSEYKRLLSFLRKHQCHLPIQGFRALPVHVAVRDEAQVADRI
jgi:DNA-binding NtrC family response regulator